MAANTTPLFVATPKLGLVRISSANTNRDGTGTLGDVITGGTFGTRIGRIVVEATGTVTDGMIRLFIFDGGSTTRAWRELPVAAKVPSATAPAFRQEIASGDNEPLLVLPPNYVLRAGTHNAETFDVTAHAGDF